jgi:methylmalonyl-CoA carboxyltransferase 5S subunit
MGRYKAMSGEFADLMLGYYGETIGPRDPQVIEAAKAHAKKESIVNRPADLLKPEWEELRTKALALKGCNGSDEDILTYAMFPQVAGKFFATRGNGPRNVGKKPAAADDPPEEAPKRSGAKQPVASRMNYKVSIGDRTHQVTVEPA